MKFGASVHSDSITPHWADLFKLDVIDLENYLFPGFADCAQETLPAIRTALAGYSGEILISGPYIDLNPGSPERLNVEATRTRFTQALDFACALGAVEIVFYSPFLPIIYLSAYEEDWITHSITFWKSFMADVDPAITISLANTIEFHPYYLARIVEAVARSNLKLTLDIGHFLVYSRIDLALWMQKIGPYCSTVFVHSNNGEMDTHDDPGQGKLAACHLTQVARAVPDNPRFIVKTNNKNFMVQRLQWVKEALKEGT